MLLHKLIDYHSLYFVHIFDKDSPFSISDLKQPQSCSEKNCMQSCKLSERGPVCSCTQGYELSNDGVTCDGMLTKNYG